MEEEDRWKERSGREEEKEQEGEGEKMKESNASGEKEGGREGR